MNRLSFNCVRNAYNDKSEQTVDVTTKSLKIFSLSDRTKRRFCKKGDKSTDLDSLGQGARFPGLLEEDVDGEGQDVAHEGNGL